MLFFAVRRRIGCGCLVKFARAFGTFGLFGAIAAIAAFPIYWIGVLVFGVLLPKIAYFFGSTNPNFSVNDAWYLIGVFYGFSWFGGAAEAFRLLFPDELQKALQRRATEEKTELSERLLTIVAGPWWLFVGYMTILGYRSENGIFLLGYNLGGPETLFSLAVVTVTAPFLVDFAIKTVRWVATGKE